MGKMTTDVCVPYWDPLPVLHLKGDLLYMTSPAQ
jgi:hypothetical protein